MVILHKSVLSRFSAFNHVKEFVMSIELISCLTKKCKGQLPELVESNGMYCFWCSNCKEQGGWSKTPRRAAFQWNAPRSEGLEKYEEMKRESELREIALSEAERVQGASLSQFGAFLASTVDEDAEDAEEYLQRQMEKD